MNVLAIGAHPDDLEFMCAGTLLKCKERGDNIFVALTTSGNTGSNVIPTKEETAATREAEQLACCEYYGAQTMFLRFDDEGLLDTPETRRAVLNAIRWANPDLILVNPPWDPSPDHGMTGKLVTEVLLSVGGKLHPSDYPPIQKMPSVFFYSKDSMLDFEADIFVDIEEQMPLKRKLCNMHFSQHAWIAATSGSENYFAKACEVRSRYCGLQAGCRYAESYIAHFILGYAPNYKLLP
jgi:LmbE family N-acetylglucosaminyl deacetylase